MCSCFGAKAAVPPNGVASQARFHVEPPRLLLLEELLVRSSQVRCGLPGSSSNVFCRDPLRDLVSLPDWDDDADAREGPLPLRLPCVPRARSVVEVRLAVQ
eukprot:68177-Amphidinium_carterae.3